MARKSKRDWLDAGMEVLAEEGVAALTIDHLARRLGVTKPSFFHHFAGQAEYRDALLMRREEWGMDAIELIPETADEALAVLGRLVDSSPIGTGRPDPGVAIRSWSTQDSAVGAFVRRVDGQRLQHAEDLLAVVIGDRPRARVLASMLYALVLGCGHVRPPAEHATMLAFYAEFKRLLRAAPR